MIQGNVAALGRGIDAGEREGRRKEENKREIDKTWRMKMTR